MKKFIKKIIENLEKYLSIINIFICASILLLIFIFNQYLKINIYKNLRNLEKLENFRNTKNLKLNIFQIKKTLYNKQKNFDKLKLKQNKEYDHKKIEKIFDSESNKNKKQDKNSDIIRRMFEK